MEVTTELSETTEERDFRIYVTDNLKPGAQCLKVANKAMIVLQMVIKHIFHSLDVRRIPDHLQLLYKTVDGVLHKSLVALPSKRKNSLRECSEDGHKLSTRVKAQKL